MPEHILATYSGVDFNIYIYLLEDKHNAALMALHWVCATSAYSIFEQRAPHKTDKLDQYDAHHLGLSCMPPRCICWKSLKTASFCFDFKHARFAPNKMFSGDLIHPKWIFLLFVVTLITETMKPSQLLRCCMWSNWQTAEIETYRWRHERKEQ